MDVETALKSRCSIRKYLPKPVSQELIEVILDAATRAPSGKNAQPWEFLVLTGDLLKEIGEANVAALRSGADPGSADVSDYPAGRFLPRSQEVAKMLYDSVGIKRNDKAKRQEWWEYGFRFFDAPAAIIIHFGPDINYQHAFFDLGLVSQSICLMACEKGLGTCITRQGVVYPQIIRAYTNMPEQNTPGISIAIGYPDWSFPANNVVTTRVSISDNTDWYGFYSS